MYYRTHDCGSLGINNLDDHVTLSGWVQKVRDKGHLVWVDLRDRYGITQLVVDEDRSSPDLINSIKNIGREFVIKVSGKVLARESKNLNIPTGEIEVLLEDLEILSKSKLPPFTIEDQTDGGEELRMRYRYLDIRRNPLKEALIFRHNVVKEVRNYLSDRGFIDIETPYLIKSTPEGARDFVVPSRLHKGQFYSLPQSPQTFKQLLMVGGLDKYFQIVKCFRDEDLRSDRQPEFTQIDCEMSFVTSCEIIEVFGNMLKHLLKTIKGVEIKDIPLMPYDQVMAEYGSDKPDIRFGMKIKEITDLVKGKGFSVFDSQIFTAGIVLTGGAKKSRKEIDKIIEWVKTPQIAAKGLVWVKYTEEGSISSSVSKFFQEQDIKAWLERAEAKPDDLLLIMSGDIDATREQLGSLRLWLASQHDLRPSDVFKPLWVVDFPLLEEEENGGFRAMHHPFTAPKETDKELLDSQPQKVKAQAYDLVLNGFEVGGGSVRIYDRNMQNKMLSLLGFSKEDAELSFGFLMNAFEYGAPPHAGIAIGLDRLVTLMAGQEVIRDFIAFPKNNAAKDVMIDAPGFLDPEQLKELNISIS